MADNDKKLVFLTGAGASKPLELPLMADLIDERFLGGLNGQAEVVAHLAFEWARINTRALDFEYIYTLAHLLADVKFDDPLAFALVPDADVTTRWVRSGAKSSQLRLNEVKSGARDLREKLRIHLHTKLKSFDRQKAAALYGGFLRPLILRLASVPSIEVFTTNYDRVVESIWERQLHNDAFGTVTELRRGFRQLNRYGSSMEWDPTDYDEEMPPGDWRIKLFKLHGSLNWRVQDETVLETSANEYSAEESTLIYPLKGLKDYEREPFRTLFERWRSAVFSATDCIAIGSSMRDPAVVEPLETAANQSPGFRLWLLDPEAEKVRKTLPEAIRGRTEAITAKFGDEEVGERVAELVFSRPA